MPAASVNDEILSAQLRHSVYLHRFSANVVRRIIALLNRVDADLVAQLLKRDPFQVSGAWSRKRLEALLDAIREINRTAYRQVEVALRGEIQGLVQYEADFQQRLLTSLIPVSFDVVTPSAQMLKAAVLARPFQGRLLREWVQGLDAASFARLRDAVRIGFVEGQTISQIVQRVVGTRALRYTDGILEISRRSARTMVQTAIAETASFAKEELYKENADLIKAVMWVSALDSKVCVRCGELDGQTFPVGEGPRPALHVNCRCTSVGITKTWRELGIDMDEVPGGARASMNGAIPGKITYEEWMRGKSAAFQDDVLGPSKGKLFRAGGLDLGDFVSRAGRELTLDQLKILEASAFEKAGLAA